MVITSLKPSSVANYFSSLAVHASSIPGCKVKQSHLLEAASRIEGLSNWRAMKAKISQQKDTHNYIRKHVGMIFHDGMMKIISVDIELNVLGYRGRTIRVYASPDMSDGFWVEQCVPSFEGYHLNGTISAAEAMDNLKNALGEVVELCNWFNTQKKGFMLSDFSDNWTIAIEGLTPLDHVVLWSLYELGLVESNHKTDETGIDEYFSGKPRVEIVFKARWLDAKLGITKTKTIEVCNYEGVSSTVRKMHRYIEENLDKHIYFERIKP